MSLISITLVVIVTVFINIFVTAFLIARSQQSGKQVQRLMVEANTIIKDIDRAMEAQVSVAEHFIKELDTRIAIVQKPSSQTRKKTNRAEKTTSTDIALGIKQTTSLTSENLLKRAQKIRDEAEIHLEQKAKSEISNIEIIEESRAKKDVKFGDTHEVQSTLDTKECISLREKISKMIDQGKSDAYIQAELHISKVELMLAKVIHFSQQ